MWHVLTFLREQCKHTWHWSPCRSEHSPPTGSSTQNPFQAWRGSRWCDPPSPAASRTAGGTAGQTQRETDYQPRCTTASTFIQQDFKCFHCTDSFVSNLHEHQIDNIAFFYLKNRFQSYHWINSLTLRKHNFIYLKTLNEYLDQRLCNLLASYKQLI